MDILTITCHDVYNVGASLQAYALMKYLEQCGHNVEIIDYKPNYLSKHYSLTTVNNKKYDKLGIKQLYLLAKLPGRVMCLFSKKKHNFDMFRKNYLKLTSIKYKRFNELKEKCPNADLFIAGSDQIWNPLFQNGKDPVFFLQFVPEKIKRVSYAASFAVDKMEKDDFQRIRYWLESIDKIAVRESSGVKLIEEMGLKAVRTCDPVFLLDEYQWEKIISHVSKNQKYILLYDFEQNCVVEEIAKEIAEEKKAQIISVFKTNIQANIYSDMGPLEFLDLVKNAEFIISNSFHATAFSIIFHKEFCVVKRKENINTRMIDLLKEVGLEDRMVGSLSELKKTKSLNWDYVDNIIKEDKNRAKKYLNEVTGER